MEIRVEKNMSDIRVDKYLTQVLDISRSQISKSKIYINGKSAKLSTKIKENDLVKIEIEKNYKVEVIENDIFVPIVYEDDYLLVVNKPYNLVVHPCSTHKGDSLVGSLIAKSKNLSTIDELRPGIVHRLDKDTSGLLIIAKDNNTHLKLQEMFKNHSLTKIYLAILKGNFKYDKITVKNYIGRDKKNRKKISSNTTSKRLAISHFEKIKANDKISLVKIQIDTGRTHQIRVHASQLNYPVLYDKLYSKYNKEERQQLHSYYLKFIHPITKKTIELYCDIPCDMKKNIEKYGLGDFDVRI